MTLKTRIVTVALAATVLALSAAGAFAHQHYGYSGYPSWWWFHHEHFHHYYYGGYPFSSCFSTWHGEVCINP
jgi:hypothetical protein